MLFGVFISEILTANFEIYPFKISETFVQVPRIVPVSKLKDEYACPKFSNTIVHGGMSTELLRNMVHGHFFFQGKGALR